MAEYPPEKQAASPEVDSQDHASSQHDGDHELARPTGWMYKGNKIGPLKIPYYASPKAQLLLVSFVCFLCPGTSAHIIPHPRSATCSS